MKGFRLFSPPFSFFSLFFSSALLRTGFFSVGADGSFRPLPSNSRQRPACLERILYPWFLDFGVPGTNCTEKQYFLCLIPECERRSHGAGCTVSFLNEPPPLVHGVVYCRWGGGAVLRLVVVRRSRGTEASMWPSGRGLQQAKRCNVQYGSA